MGIVVENTTIAVLGAGSWGTALALLLAQGDTELGGVRLWDRTSALVDTLRIARENKRYLPGFRLPTSIMPVYDVEQAVEGASCVVLVVPSDGIAGVLTQAAPYLAADCDIVLASKGLEATTGRLPSEITRDTLGDARSIIALSGPNLASEVARDIPTAAVAACPDSAAAVRVRNWFNRRFFRVYTSSDRIGVELGGAVKNVLAIAGGVSDGLGFGDNTKATVLTRGLTEMARFGVASGAAQSTFYGLAGVGDLMATAASRLSRNYRVGEALARGESLDAILAHLGQVAEGVNTAHALIPLAARIGVEMPVCAAIARLLFEGASPAQEVAALMSREPKGE